MSAADFLWPGPSWNGTAGSGGAAPTESAVLHGSGFEQKVICAADIGSNFWLGGGEEAPYIGNFEALVGAEIAFPSGGVDEHIKEVEFHCEGLNRVVSTQSKSLRNGNSGWSCSLNASAFPLDGDIDVYATVRPFNGYERLLGPFRIHVNHGSTLTRTVKTVKVSGGDYTTIHQAWLNAPSGGIIKVDSGTWNWDDADTGTNNAPARAITIQPASGVRGDVEISKSTLGYARPRCTRTVWQKIKFDVHKIQPLYVLAPAGSIGHHTFINCDFINPFGADGPLYGYASLNTYVVRFDAPSVGANTKTQRNYFIGCNFVCGNAGGGSLYDGCTIEHSWDSISITANDVPAIGVFNTTCSQLVQQKYRGHSEETLTVATVSFNGTNTTVTFSGSPTLTTVAGGEWRMHWVEDGGVDVFEDWADIRVPSDPARSWSNVSMSNATKTMVVSGNASALAPGDKVIAYLIAHADWAQWVGSGNLDGCVFFQRYDCEGVTAQHLLFQPGAWPGTGTFSSTGATVTTSIPHGYSREGFYVKLTNGAQSGQIRRVTAVPTSTTLTLLSAFTVDQSGRTYVAIGAVRDVAFQICKMRMDHDILIAHWQNGCRHIVFRQCTMLGSKHVLRNLGSSHFVVEDCAVVDSIYRNLTADTTFPTTGIVVDNNHFEEGPAPGTNATSGDVIFDADYCVVSGTTNTIPSPRVLWDGLGNPVPTNGTALVGARQGAAVLAVPRRRGSLGRTSATDKRPRRGRVFA